MTLGGVHPKKMGCKPEFSMVGAQGLEPWTR
jgi:hypothetical protein